MVGNKILHAPLDIRATERHFFFFDCTRYRINLNMYVITKHNCRNIIVCVYIYSICIVYSYIGNVKKKLAIKIFGIILCKI